jgi:tetratricopeptide (TPR) repeat protein
MEVNYCGNCGAAARSQVGFCRQCGTEFTGDSEAPPLSPSRSTDQIASRHTVAAAAIRATRSENGQPHPATPAPPEATPEPETSVVVTEPVITGSSPQISNRKASSSALALASGLEGTSPFGSRVRLSLIGLALLIVGVASGVYYRQSLRVLHVYSPERNLVTPEEQSLDLIRLGNRSNELGQYEKAVGQFKEALALTPEHLPIYLLLAQSYQASGQVDEALRAYWTLLRQDPKNLEARLEVAEILRARGNWREAYQEYQRVINMNSQSLEAIAALAVIEAHDEREYVPIGVNLTKRQVPRTKVAALVPSLPGTGGAAPLAPPRVQGNALTAPPTLLAAEEAERGDARALAESHKTLGTRYHNVREYLAAIKEFSIALRLTPGDKDLYYLLGSCYDGLDQDALAHSFYKQCDSGTYADVAYSGAQRTLKAAVAERKKQESTNTGSDTLLPSRPTGQTLK